MISPVFAIWKKDMKALLVSPMFYLLIGLCCCLWGLYFSFEVYRFVQRSYQITLQGQQSGLNIYHHMLSSYVVIVHYILIFIIAALSIRFFAEEKKLKTFSLLLYSPLTSWQIVLAKWLVGLSLVFLLCLISAVFPMSLAYFTELPWSLLLLGYLGLFLILSLYMTAALLASSLTESMIISVVLSFIFIISILLMGIGRELLSPVSMQEFFNFLSIDQHFGNFRQGLLSFSSLLYLLSGCAVLGLVTERVVEYHRWR